ncbi:MAG: hypothetical protein MSC31_00845 [Solirubrobacteraceae bacterium MAG38_C4-C5]|nr:hypothetical protein [Candidatus Siliceabacter maunaloa]
MTRARAIAIPALLAATLLAGCGGDEDAENISSVADVASAGADQIGETVAVEGRAYPIADIGFALAGEEAAVLVAALPSEIAKLSDGEPVRIQGRIEPIGAGRALRLDQEASATRGLGLPRNDDALAELQLGQGAPAIVDPSITGEDGPGPPGPVIDGG